MYIIFFIRGFYLYGLCLRLFIFLCVYYISPRLPSSGNRRLCCSIFWLSNIIFYVSVFFCCIYFVVFSQQLFIVEGGGFIDLPGIKYYSRFFY
uniref:Ribosomal protein S12 n=1 Tax=Crithidia fasciculata TaxID=5656 RepID=Q31761_CRIFA|nr:ribosomal protein S12 [Crithidia fasciculata]